MNQDIKVGWICLPDDDGVPVVYYSCVCTTVLEWRNRRVPPSNGTRIVCPKCTYTYEIVKHIVEGEEAEEANLLYSPYKRGEIMLKVREVPYNPESPRARLYLLSDDS